MIKDRFKSFLTLWEKKVFIILFTLVVTLLQLFMYYKKSTPIYQESINLEIGKIQSENFWRSKS